MKTLIATFGFLMMAASLAPAQDVEPRYRGQGYVYFGLGTGMAGSGYHPVVDQVGFGGEGFLYKGLGLGAEAGYAHWGPFAQAWIGSADASYHFGRHAARGKVDPFVVGGFSIFGPTSSGGGRGAPGGNFGGGLNLWLGKHAALRFEARDHGGGDDYIPGNQYLSFRIGVTFR
jgi:hypothetical protein